jgi:hypothetical protein
MKAVIDCHVAAGSTSVPRNDIIEGWCRAMKRGITVVEGIDYPSPFVPLPQGERIRGRSFMEKEER